jgi:hypothetical protein
MEHRLDLPVPCGEEIKVASILDDIRLQREQSENTPETGSVAVNRLRPGHLRPTPSLPFSPPQLAPMGKVEGRELSKTYSDVFLEMGMNVFGSTSVMYNPVDGLIEVRVSDPEISQTRRECRGKTSKPTFPPRAPGKVPRSSVIYQVGIDRVVRILGWRRFDDETLSAARSGNGSAIRPNAGSSFQQIVTTEQ